MVRYEERSFGASALGLKYRYELGYLALPEELEKEVKEKLLVKGCRYCGTSFEKLPVSYYYPHPEGWAFPGVPVKMWLFIQCTGCNYQHSLWKLGYGRTSAETEAMRERCQMWQKQFEELRNRKLLTFEGADP